MSPSISQSQSRKDGREDGEGEFDTVKFYADLLEKDEELSMPIAAMKTLCEVVQTSNATTMQELLAQLGQASSDLSKASLNPVSLTAGTELFIRFITSQRPPLNYPFNVHKQTLTSRIHDFISSSKYCSQKISRLAEPFILQDSVILVHGYSRVVIGALLHAAKSKSEGGGGKKFKVLVTEARPFGLGVEMQRELEKEGVESVVILDSAVAYAMAKVDYVMVGSEAVGIDGGLVNFIGSYQIAICAKLLGKTLYALTESYKFTRLFPLSQYDIPTSKIPLSFPSTSNSTYTLSESPIKKGSNRIPRRTLTSSALPSPLLMTSEQVDNNPLLDYTPPDLVGLVISDVGCLTSEGVADLLLSIFGGE